MKKPKAKSKPDKFERMLATKLARLEKESSKYYYLNEWLSERLVNTEGQTVLEILDDYRRFKSGKRWVK